MKKKGTWKSRLAGMLMLTALFVFMGGMSVMAASSKTVSMSKVAKNTLGYEGAWGTDAPTVYHKFTVKSPCVVSVTGYKITSYGTYGMNVILCDSKKKSLERYSSGNYIKWTDEGNSTSAMYPLTKGTYYIKTSGMSSYKFTVQMVYKYNNKTTIKDSGGSSKKKAKSLSAKSTVYGIIGVGESAGKADWFKLNVKKSQVLTFTIMGQGAMSGNNASVSFTLYGPSFKKGIAMGDLYNQSGTVYTIKKDQWGIDRGKLKVKKGTYYIKICRGKYYKDKKRGAIYSIKWK